MHYWSESVLRGERDCSLRPYFNSLQQIDLTISDKTMLDATHSEI